MVSKLRRELSMAIKRNKDFLEGSYLGELKEIQAQRAALDTWERNAKNAMINGDSQCLDDPDKILASVVQYLSPSGSWINVEQRAGQSARNFLMEQSTSWSHHTPDP
jgi:hypothetical protein